MTVRRKLAAQSIRPVFSMTMTSMVTSWNGKTDNARSSAGVAGWGWIVCEREIADKAEGGRGKGREREGEGGDSTQKEGGG